MGKWVADKIQQEKEVKAKRLTELREKDDKSEQELKHKKKKQMSFKQFIMKLKKKIRNFFVD